MDNRIVDLHVHSTESDGTFTPTEVIAEAKKAGLSAIALTDHDTATGIRKAMGAAKEAGIELIPGIELSTAYTFPGKKQEKEIHIVGLYINPDDPELLKMTAEFRECRDKRNEKMIAALSSGNLLSIAGALENVFEVLCSEEESAALSKARSLLLENGAAGALLSGSGSALFGLSNAFIRDGKRQRSFGRSFSLPPSLIWCILKPIHSKMCNKIL